MEDLKSNLKNSFLLALLSSLGVFLRPDLFGADSYATWLYIKGTQGVYLNFQPFARILFDFMPDSLLFFKLTMFLSLFLFFFVCLLIIKDYRVVLFLVALSPLILFEFAKFENELFAYPLIMLSFFLFSKSEKKYWLLGFFVTGVASLFWAFSIFSVLFLFPFVFFLFFLIPKFFEVNTATESWFGFSIYLLAGWILVLPFVFRCHWKKMLCVSIFLVFFFINSKFWIFLVPYCLLGVVELKRLLEEREFDINSLIVPAIILVLCWNVALFMNVPTQNEWVLAQEITRISFDDDLPIINDWSYGYWIKFVGGKASNMAGGTNPVYQEMQKPFVALTDANLETLDCERVFLESSLRREAQIWKC